MKTGCYILKKGDRKLGMDTSYVKVEDKVILTIREMHERGLIVRVRAVSLFGRNTLEYCADTAIHYNDDGQETRTAFYPIYKNTYRELLATGAYEPDTGMLNTTERNVA